jgi:hypothetical protein
LPCSRWQCERPAKTAPQRQNPAPAAAPARAQPCRGRLADAARRLPPFVNMCVAAAVLC